MAMTVSQFNFLTKALQPEIGMKPYWSNGFIPFANKTAATGQAIGNGYYLHCNLAGPPVTPGVWVNSDGVSMGSNVYADWVAEFGAGRPIRRASLPHSTSTRWSRTDRLDVKRGAGSQGPAAGRRGLPDHVSPRDWSSR